MLMAVKITPALAHTLHQLSADASDRIGRPISSSAVLRALVAYAGEQSPAWAITELDPLIEREIVAGRVWGSKKQG
jgi:hypothetical protein